MPPCRAPRARSCAPVCEAAWRVRLSWPPANAAAAAPAKPHLNSARLLGAILLARLSVLFAEVVLLPMQFAFVEFTGGVTEQIYWQAASRREFILSRFRSLLSNLAGLVSIKASSCSARLPDTEPNGRLCAGLVCSSSLPPPLGSSPKVQPLRDCRVHVLPGNFSHWPSKNQEAELIPYASDGRAELRNNELPLIRGQEVRKCFGDFARSLSPC